MSVSVWGAWEPIEGLRHGSERRGGDHRSDYFSCCCVIARSLACD